jgi:hypothetical protein
VDTGSRLDGAPVYDMVKDVSEASWKTERLMRDDAAWQDASRRALAYFNDNHSVDAIVGNYEREFEALLARP